MLLPQKGRYRALSTKIKNFKFIFDCIRHPLFPFLLVFKKGVIPLATIYRELSNAISPSKSTHQYRM